VSVLEEGLAPPTRFDLRFRVGDIPVRVHPFFWLTTVLLGLNSPSDLGVPRYLLYLLIWVAIVFVSILVHELGHVLMGRRLGSRGHILLTGFCGLAIGSSELPDRWQRNAVSLAGPGAGFVLAALVTLLSWRHNPAFTQYALGSVFHVDVEIGPELLAQLPHPIVSYIITTTLFINIYWGLVNLLPIWPLDGGQISREIYEHYRGRDGVRLSLILSLVTSGVLAALALVEWITQPEKPLVPFVSFGKSLFAVLFFGLLALQSWQILRFIRLAGPDWETGGEEPRAPWERDADWWKRGEQP
jgi:Zn-dependent protease